MSSLSSPTLVDFLCCGAVLPWTVRPVYKTFPLHFLDQPPESSGFHLASVVEDPITFEAVIRVRSKRCCLRLYTEAGTGACAKCLTVLTSSGLRRFMQRASTSWKPYMRYEDMTRTQFIEAIHYKNSTLTTTRVQRYRAEKRAETAEEKSRLHERLVAALAMCNVPRLQRLLQVALDQGRSIEEILNRIEDAVANIYRVKSFSTTEIDLARIMWHLAGDKGAYILHKALGFPSVSAIRMRSRSTHPVIHPSPAKPTFDHIVRNLLSVFPPSPARHPCRCGQAIMFDGIAIRKCIREDDDYMVGGCRECTTNMDLSMSCLKNILALAKAVRRGDNGEDPLAHFGVEATVGAMGALRDVDFHGYSFS
ncbi:uncharacterized protein PHACADRAFT_23773 [Phanerochaete carnosa HHB-10118-sp]|uniref:Uncharacterized protein n=1 Tax=Phanerochaete carnosa (strain HHB-10118-sp) TaxID=650164 RepID=K5VBY4_PHACS|nr:uncharacterized protein PHACADRAFT_23773 [Phanerochaete carnosa HHB-10118-sp]EKM60426.1 hypothetical protein PHACADRAFT_23773 [Phanerochaete carnosa HHB-10118-sp]